MGPDVIKSALLLQNSDIKLQLDTEIQRQEHLMSITLSYVENMVAPDSDLPIDMLSQEFGALIGFMLVPTIGERRSFQLIPFQSSVDLLYHCLKEYAPRFEAMMAGKISLSNFGTEPAFQFLEWATSTTLEKGATKSSMTALLYKLVFIIFLSKLLPEYQA